MNYNLLLEYMSELETGLWSRFRQTLDVLNNTDVDPHPSTRARELSALGHIEFAFDSNLQWCVAPAVFSWQAMNDEQCGVLCGRRTHRLLCHIYDIAKTNNLKVEKVKQPDAPDVIMIYAPTQKIADDFTHRCGAESEHRFPAKLANLLPHLNVYTSLLHEKTEPTGYGIKKFSHITLGWDTVESTSEEGFYWYDTYRPTYRLKFNMRCVQVSRSLGIFLWLQQRKQTVIEYDIHNQTLSIPTKTPLPILWARAATLSSGCLPEPFYKNGLRYERYHNISSALGWALMDKLGQKAKI